MIKTHWPYNNQSIPFSLKKKTLNLNLNNYKNYQISNKKKNTVKKRA